VLSIEILVAVVVGGTATLAGPIVGAMFLEWSPEFIEAGDGQLSIVIFGALLILLMRVAPGGVLGGLKLLLVRLWPPKAPPMLRPEVAPAQDVGTE
jgi:ABC-type branched-subunit amino acid transport system permease subunit